jgi:hypothetical protein
LVLSGLRHGAVRLVCAGWKAVHDALVTRLVLRRETTDEAVGMLVLRFPAVASVEMKSVPGETLALTDQGVRALSSLPALSSLDLRYCATTIAGVRALRSTTAALACISTFISVSGPA